MPVVSAGRDERCPIAGCRRSRGHNITMWLEIHCSRGLEVGISRFSTSLKNPNLLSLVERGIRFGVGEGEAHPNSPTTGLHRDGAQERWSTDSVCSNSRPTHQGSTQSSTAGVTCARSPFTTGFSVVSMSLKSTLTHRWPWISFTLRTFRADSPWDEQGEACAPPKSLNDLRLTSDSTSRHRAHTRQSSC